MYRKYLFICKLEGVRLRGIKFVHKTKVLKKKCYKWETPICGENFEITRPKPPYGQQGLAGGIGGPGYNPVGTF